MAIYGLEWIVVAVVILVLFLWGPEKLPKLARSFGQAKREFEKASRELESEVASIKSSTSSIQGSSRDDQLLEAARVLGIATEGKTREQIASEISERIKQKA